MTIESVFMLLYASTIYGVFFFQVKDRQTDSYICCHYSRLNCYCSISVSQVRRYLQLNQNFNILSTIGVFSFDYNTMIAYVWVCQNFNSFQRWAI